MDLWGDMHQVQPLIWLKQVKMKLLLLALRSLAVVVQRHHKAWVIVHVVQDDFDKGTGMQTVFQNMYD